MVFGALLFALTLGSCGKPPNDTPDSKAQPNAPAIEPAPTIGPEPNQPIEGEVAAPSEADVVDIGSVTITAEAGANRGAPIDVDLVFVFDAELAGQIETKSATDWFKSKTAVVEDAGESLNVISWRVAPGETVSETPVDAPGSVAAFLFVKYSTPGDHRLRITGSGMLSILLGATEATFEVEQ